MKFDAQQSEILKQKMIRDGYIIADFQQLECIYKIQEKIKLLWKFDPVLLHQHHLDDELRLLKIKQIKDDIVKNQLVKSLLFENIHLFDFLFGSDIDVQDNIHLRLSRPNMECDLVDWHRDTFYGNSLWEVIVWFPIFPLEDGVGLTIVENSHLEVAKNVRFIEDKNSFRKNVVKGSIANEIGYVYAPKTDDSIESIDSASIKLLSPRVGQAILFFGHIIHRAQNHSTKTRISIDVRMKNMFAPTNTKPGYYQPLTRGCVAQYVEKMESKGVLCGN